MEKARAEAGWLMPKTSGYAACAKLRRRGDYKEGTMDFFDECEIKQSIQRIDELLGSGIFDRKHIGNVLYRSAFIDLLICLRDLMFKCRKFSEPIRFTDDVVVTDEIKHVSDLVKYVRDAVCHPDSDAHYLEPGNIRASLNVLYGKGTLIQTGDFNSVSEHDDDVCFFIGRQRIYLQRHIVRAFNEAKDKLLPLVEAASQKAIAESIAGIIR
ncbi:hypothetical protein [Cupriavidus sp. DL-D2]|uniref:hypothetical protein n=1 Tax=Cupriavidus sp. DL-D2 TaxID=3144974 RepID=UPI0032120AD5